MFTISAAAARAGTVRGDLPSFLTLTSAPVLTYTSGIGVCKEETSMNLWLRCLWLLLTAWRRPRLDLGPGLSILRLRVLPNDVDVAIHLNNGRYLTMMDLGRLDFMIRSGVVRLVVSRRLTPVVGTAAIRFRRELGLFQSFDLETRVVARQENMVIFEQRFRFASGLRSGQIAATALVRAGLYDRKSRSMVPLREIADALATTLPPEAPPTASTQGLIDLDRALQADTARSADQA
jgi:acyl-CoA thioesterase FadM